MFVAADIKPNLKRFTIPMIYLQIAFMDNTQDNSSHPSLCFVNELCFTTTNCH